MVGLIRPLKVSDEKLFTNKQLVNSGKIVSEICKRAWVKLVDPGPYKFSNGTMNWDQLLQGDVFYLFFQIRKLSYGPVYEFNFRCDICGKTIMTSVNIDEDLDVRELSDDAKDAVSSGQPMETKLEDGRIIRFRQLRMADEQQADRLATGRNLLTIHAMTIQRILFIEGIDTPDGQPDTIEFARFVEQLSPGEFDLLREKMEEQDCGLDTEHVVVCSNPDCGEESVIDIPLQSTFFQRRRARTVEAAKRRKEKLRKQRAQPSKEMNG
jgi:hypothetical protein